MTLTELKDLRSYESRTFPGIFICWQQITCLSVSDITRSAVLTVCLRDRRMMCSLEVVIWCSGLFLTLFWQLVISAQNLMLGWKQSESCLHACKRWWHWDDYFSWYQCWVITCLAKCKQEKNSVLCRKMCSVGVTHKHISIVTSSSLRVSCIHVFFHTEVCWICGFQIVSVSFSLMCDIDTRPKRKSSICSGGT